MTTINEAIELSTSRSFKFGARDAKPARKGDRGPSPKHYELGHAYGKWCRAQYGDVSFTAETIAAWLDAETELR